MAFARQPEMHVEFAEAGSTQFGWNGKEIMAHFLSRLIHCALTLATLR